MRVTMNIDLGLTRFAYPLVALFYLALGRFPAVAVPLEANPARTNQTPMAALPSPPSAVFRPAAYTPAGLRLTFTPDPRDKSKGILDFVLIPLQDISCVGRFVLLPYCKPKKENDRSNQCR